MQEENYFEEELQDTDEVNEETPDELSLLKERATLMGIKFSPNIGIDKLKERIEEKKNPPKDDNQPPFAEYAREEYDTIQAAQHTAQAKQVAPLQRPTPLQEKMARRDKALQLVRIRVANMNPINSNLKGDIISAGNSELGMIKKFVPFNAEHGWHVPQILLDVLQNKKFMTHYEVKIGNKRIKKHKLVPEYSIEILPPLTSAELDALKQRQLMAQGQ